MDLRTRRRLGIDYRLPDITERQSIYVLPPPPRRALMTSRHWAVIAFGLACFAAGICVGLALQ